MNKKISSKSLSRSNFLILVCMIFSVIQAQDKYDIKAHSDKAEYMIAMRDGVKLYTIAGPVIANLFVSTTGTDADWIVKLIDVYPGDTPDNRPNPCDVRMGHLQMLVGADVFRGKYRNSFEKPEPFIPDEVTEIKYDLRDKCHTFKNGHRIMVQIQSTWFPVIDRNPQKFVDIYHAKESDFQKVLHKVYRSATYSSHIKLRIIQ